MFIFLPETKHIIVNLKPQNLEIFLYTLHIHTFIHIYLYFFTHYIFIFIQITYIYIYTHISLHSTYSYSYIYIIIFLYTVYIFIFMQFIYIQVNQTDRIGRSGSTLKQTRYINNMDNKDRTIHYNGKCYIHTFIHIYIYSYFLMIKKNFGINMCASGLIITEKLFFHGFS